MDDAVLVRVFQRLRDVDEHRNDIEVARAAKLSQVAARGQVHGQGRKVAFPIGRLHFENERVLQLAGDGVLTHQPRPCRFALCQRRAQNLERDFNTRELIARAPDFRLPAGTQLFDQGVARG